MPRREPAVTDAPSGEPESFLERWSRRKREPRESASVDVAGEPGETREDPAPAEAPAPMTDADMPPLETLDESSDYSPFFSEQVSEALRRRALRQLFHSAKFNVVDGLDDYDEDFRNFAPLGDMITADMRHRMEREAEQAKQAVAEAQAPEASDAEQNSEAGAAGEPMPATEEGVEPGKPGREEAIAARSDETAEEDSTEPDREQG